MFTGEKERERDRDRDREREGERERERERERWPQHGAASIALTRSVFAPGK
jgi:hypothetical protein